MLRRFWTATPQSLDRLPYGMGFGVQELPGDPVVGHQGGFPGVSDSFEMHLGTGVTAVVLANYSGAAHAVDAKLTELLSELGGKEQPPAESRK